MRLRALAVIAVLMLISLFGADASSQGVLDSESLEIPEITFEGEVTVTGSLIPRNDLTALSPVTVMEIPTELTYSGVVRIEDLVTTMPQVFAGQNSTISNGASGTASIDLRNLGERRTLVLVNGRRMAFGDYNGADLNAIPAPLIKRVDVLTGGASTVYGSDALAGVVNFIMDKDFVGVRGGLQYSFYNHDNNNEVAQRINREVDFDVPSGIITDGDAINGNVALGGEFADGKGHAVVYLGYRTIDSLTKASRDYLNCTAFEGPDGPYCGGSSTTPTGRFTAFNADGSFNGAYTLHTVDEGGDGHSFRPWLGEQFNYGEYNHIQRPDEKWNAGAFADYEINEHFDLYMEVMYMNDFTDAQIAPSGNFAVYNLINCDNPMLSEQQRDLICVQGGYGPNDYAFVYQQRRDVEGDPRISRIGHNDARLVAGLRGDISDAWSYDLYWLRAESRSQSSLNDLSIERIGYALDVIEDPATGEWVCRNEQARAAGCVPWNIYQEGAVTQEAVDYIATVGVEYDQSRTEVVNLTITGDLEGAGIKIPSASEGLQLAVGAEYRSQTLQTVPDEVFATGDAAGFIGTAIRIDGGFNVRELFVEALLPLVQDVRGARDLSLELGYRFSDYYQTSGGFDTYKAMASWAINDSWRLRGGYNRAVREPSLFELYEPTYEWGDVYVDLCAGPEPGATFEECARTGVTAEQYGNIPVFQIPGVWEGSNAIFGGNPNLDPETGDTYTAGLVWTPQSIRGLSVTLDYYTIEISDAIDILAAETIHRVCMDTGDPAYCDLIHRDSLGSIAAYDFGGYTDLSNLNVGRLKAEGIDLNVSYLIGLGGAGYVATDLMGSYLLSGALHNPYVDFECAGYFGFQCGQPKSRWRHRFRATWESEFRLNLSLGWRYLGPAYNDDASPNPALGDPEYMEIWRINGSDRIRHYNWFDLAASYTMRNGLKLTVGVNNVLDEEPPLLPGMADAFWINLYGNYDPLGRYIFGSVQFNF